ncbi:MAG TPA: hypothetical protein PL009_08475 [Flavipsychrobacter sp.]|nr:hypothetical protein [Flavipsychrobacter sp.]
MKKIIITAAVLVGINAAANAQQVNANNASGTAQQAVQLALSNALEITFVAANAATGATVALPFTTSDHYENGVESDEQQLKIRSNKNFGITVKTSAATFTVNDGQNTSSSSMPTSVLGLAVTDNNTGGLLGQGFSSSTYNSLSATATNLITGAGRGGNQNFKVKYKATPGFAYPAGLYATDVIFTATQQ